MVEFKSVSTPNEIAELLNKVMYDMAAGGSSPTDRARAVKAIGEHFGVDMIEDYVEADSRTDREVEKNMKLRTITTTAREINFDDRVYDDLELLAKATNRSVEELIHTAVITLLKDNEDRFVRNILTDNLYLFLSGDLERDSCNIANIEIECADVDGGTQCILHCINRDKDGSVIEDYEREYDVDSIDDMDELKKHLEYVGEYNIDRDHADVKSYLKHRMDYR